jgi:hypothetical protein
MVSRRERERERERERRLRGKKAAEKKKKIEKWTSSRSSFFSLFLPLSILLYSSTSRYREEPERNTKNKTQKTSNS